ncbi:DNA replication helicase Dna2 [Pelomyxa schiedti]|nr:DNA replication helicase Dna2 [Pelomyxa schiedti]
MTHTKCVAIVYRGRIVEVDSKKIVVQSDSLLRGGQLDIEDMASHMSWNIDKEDETSSFPHMQSNLCALFENNPTAAKIRSLLIDLVTPRFDTVPESDETLSQQLFPLSQSLSYNNLNVQQKFAIKRALAAKDYLLIHGMPGTGKTTTIAYLVQALVHRGKRVLIVAYTHNAIDNVLLKLIDLKIRFLRIGRPETVHVKVKPYATEENKSLTIDALKALLDSTQVIGATCLGVKNVIVKSQHYDCCIVDEASQITVPVCLPPIMLSSRFILVGDHMQLPPLVRSEPAKQEGFDKSLFFLLSESHPEAVIELYLQYRMNSDIMLIANKLVYSDKLKCIDTTVENAKLDVRNHRATSPRWVYECLEPSRKVIFLDTDNVPAQEFHSGGSVWNDTEALIVCMIISELVSCGIQCQSIGVITPYRGQTRCIAAALKQELRAQPQAVGEVEVHTIDSYQGRDKDCVIFSMVCSNPELRVGDLLEDLRRINVACTRAKKKLVFVGSRRTMDQSGIWQQFLALAQSRGWIYSMPPRPQSLPNKPLHVGDLP